MQPNSLFISSPPNKTTQQKKYKTSCGEEDSSSHRGDRIKTTTREKEVLAQSKGGVQLPVQPVAAQPAVGAEQGGLVNGRKTKPGQEKASTRTIKKEKLKLKNMHRKKRRLCSISDGQIGLAATRFAAVARPGPVIRT